MSQALAALKAAYEKAIALDADHPYAKGQLAALNSKAGNAVPATDTASLDSRPDTDTVTNADAGPGTKTGAVPDTRSGKTKPETHPASASADKRSTPAVAMEKAIAKAPAAQPIPGSYELQAGAFLSQANAEKMSRIMADKGYTFRVFDLVQLRQPGHSHGSQGQDQGRHWPGYRGPALWGVLGVWV